MIGFDGAEELTFTSQIGIVEFFKKALGFARHLC
jgi:hypothetical protein